MGGDSDVVSEVWQDVMLRQLSQSLGEGSTTIGMKIGVLRLFWSQRVVEVGRAKHGDLA